MQKLALQASGANAVGLGVAGAGMMSGLAGGVMQGIVQGAMLNPTEVPTRVVCLSQVTQKGCWIREKLDDCHCFSLSYIR